MARGGGGEGKERERISGPSLLGGERGGEGREEGEGGEKNE